MWRHLIILKRHDRFVVQVVDFLGEFGWNGCPYSCRQQFSRCDRLLLEIANQLREAGFAGEVGPICRSVLGEEICEPSREFALIEEDSCCRIIFGLLGFSP